ncbi:hypothetical protein QQ045_026461 [Rhodiola kirilowii]
MPYGRERSRQPSGIIITTHTPSISPFAFVKQHKSTNGSVKQFGLDILTLQSPQPCQSFVAVARSSPSSLFPPIQLAPRQTSLKDGKPMNLASPTTIGALDASHVLIIPRSPEDSTLILAHPARKIGQSLFRIFRWTPDYNFKKEPTTISTWGRFPNLPTNVYDQGFIAAIASSFGHFLATDTHTKSFSNPSFARACVEIDISKELPSEVLINLGGDNMHKQEIIYENSLLYCSRCKLHDHHLNNCRKSQHQPTVARAPLCPLEICPQIMETVVHNLVSITTILEAPKDPSQSNWMTVKNRR